MFVFVEGGKPKKKQQQQPRSEEENQFNPHIAPGSGGGLISAINIGISLNLQIYFVFTSNTVTRNISECILSVLLHSRIQN